MIPSRKPSQLLSNSQKTLRFQNRIAWTWGLDLRLAAALLIAFWNKDNAHVLHWMKRELADIVLEFYPYGVGSSFDLAKFGNMVLK